MAEMASLWGYVENHDIEQLEQKLMFTTLELENIKVEARDQMIKNKEYVKNLFQLLKIAIHERDEARNQLQKLLNKSSSNIENLTNVPIFQVDKQGKTNSSVTESDSLSATYNYQSHGSSPVEPFFDTETSPEFSNMHLTSNHAFIQDHAMGSTIDEGSLLVDSLAKGRVLPQKGKFLQAVLGAGPLLKTLLLAGPLPRWRNPPQLQPFQIPPVSIKGCEGDGLTKQVQNVGNLATRMVNPQVYAQMSCGSGSAPMLSFGNMAPVNRLGNGAEVPSAIGGNGYVPLAKRQRFC